MRSILDRLKEPSSYAGLAAIAGGVDKIASGDTQGGLAIALAGALALLMPERGRAP